MITECKSAYIGGPMTGRPMFGFPDFDAVAEAARALGYEVSNPHEHDQELHPGIDDAEATKIGDVQALATEIGFSFTGAMTWDLGEVIRCSHIILLPGWERSTGARFERAAAEATGSIVLLAVPPIEPLDGDLWDLVEDDQQKRITNFLSKFDSVADFAQEEVLKAFHQLPARQLLTELQARLAHVPGMSAQLERVSARIA